MHPHSLSHLSFMVSGECSGQACGAPVSLGKSSGSCRMTQFKQFSGNCLFRRLPNCFTGSTNQEGMLMLVETVKVVVIFFLCMERHHTICRFTRVSHDPGLPCHTQF